MMAKLKGNDARSLKGEGLEFGKLKFLTSAPSIFIYMAWNDLARSSNHTLNISLSYITMFMIINLLIFTTREPTCWRGK
jgi:hypothetical protein